MGTRDLSCNSICDSFLYNHTFEYSTAKIANIVEINTDVGNTNCFTPEQVRGFKLKQPNSYNNNNRVYRCEVAAWNPADVAGQQQNSSTKMRQSKAIQRYFRFS